MTANTYHDHPSILERVIGQAQEPIRAFMGHTEHTVGGVRTDSAPSDPETLLQRLEGLIKDMSRMNLADWRTLFDAAGYQLDGNLIDDKTYFMERLIQLCVRQPDGSQESKIATDLLLKQLWNDLSHPPKSYLGDRYKYRQPDGSCNNFTNEKLGAAGQPYARTVKPLLVQGDPLPDAGDIFDSLMARTDSNREEHPNKISSMLFYLASIIIHDLFRTDHDDFSKSKTSSYLDLSPLYGSNAAEQDAMRTKRDGKIHPDCFSEKRLLGFPPGVSVLLIMFNRFHNHVVEELARRNEGGRFSLPVDDRKDPHATTWEKRDQDLFQTGRLVTCGLYINCILLDYVRTILNLNKTKDDWALNPRANIPDLPIASGNQVSAEFNLVYRWHAAISARDEKWSEQEYARLFPGQDPTKIDMQAFLQALEEMEASIPDKPEQREYFRGHKRPAAGQPYDDDFLVEILVDSVEDCANSFGAQRVPVILRAVEILGIKQARAWGVATLNEFRRHFGLAPHKDFKDINPDATVVKELQRLYRHPDSVELYPGLVAESAKKSMKPGAGLAPSFTVSRAVLSDAVALVRGDRFYTVDYHPKSLTDWGFQHVASNTAVDHGCVLHKLILGAFPAHFKPNSVYAHYPFTIPEEMERVLKDPALGEADKYDFTRPKTTTN